MENRASKKRKQPAALVKKEKSSSDRFSDLPYEILEHIFSFLPIKSIAQTTVLSKHWNLLSLWRSHPHLDFSPLSNPEPRNPRRLSHKHQCKATKFVPIVLSRRQQDSNITTFRLFGHVSYSRLNKCIQHVMNHRIKQLELDVYLDCSFTLPPCLFNCNTLRVLTLNHQKTAPVQIYSTFSTCLELSYKHFNYLTSAGLSSVHTLSLTNVHFNFFEHGSDLFSGDKFPLLRNLCLKNCRGMIDLKINCPGLEILKLEVLRLKDLGIFGVGLLELQVKKCYLYADCSAKILAPSLHCLYWENKANVEFTAESFRDINTGFLFFRIKTPDAATLNRASKVLSALCFARSLSVGSQVLEILSSIYSSEGGLRYSFNNLRTLELRTYLTKDEVTGIICFLSSSPILHTVTMGVSCSMTGNETLDDDRYWSSQSQNLKSIERHLKVARIDVQGTKMSKSVVSLVKFLLRYETALQEMTLTLESDPADSPVVQRTIRSEIMKFALPSSNVIISFLPTRPEPLNSRGTLLELV
ncbi:hypothetical protein Vadar_033925 [Vaccinium darrowii]|uniref:Uncharacterized protein n=1 Tax=Vaccinium darrowii TaxID=229202 RepID=A0ACB7Z882_9ERIC|nr:hypothetical protein Vadar_033925 [Vaccinium darrowii]